MSYSQYRLTFQVLKSLARYGLACVAAFNVDFENYLSSCGRNFSRLAAIAEGTSCWAHIFVFDIFSVTKIALLRSVSRVRAEHKSKICGHAAISRWFVERYSHFAYFNKQLHLILISIFLLENAIHDILRMTGKWFSWVPQEKQFININLITRLSESQGGAWFR